MEVHIKDQIFSVECGAGRQRIQWLGDVAVHRYDHFYGLESGVCRGLELEDNTPLDVEQWQSEKVSLLAELERKNDENARLQQELTGMQTKFTRLEEAKQEADAALRNKMNNLEKNLGQLTVMHTNHVNTINKLKEDKSVLKKKIIRREERLEKLMEQLKKYREENQEYKAKLDQMVSGSRIDIPRAGTRIRKKIKGGHNPRLIGIFAPGSYEVSK